MRPRANWKGTLKIAEVTCQVALYTAASTTGRIAFHMINRASGNRVQREFVDQETGKPVDKDDQVKGYDLGAGEYLILTPGEIAEAVPQSDKILAVSEFVRCDEIDHVYFDKPYFLAPTDRSATETFSLIREGMRRNGVAAVARTVLFRRLRNLMIRPTDTGLIATTLNFDYEVRSAKEAFKDIPPTKIEGEMLELARHIIKTKMGKFDVSQFDDRYENALAELVSAKLEGRKIEPPPQPQRGKVVDLMAALRESAAAGISKSKPARKATKSPPSTSKRKSG